MRLCLAGEPCRDHVCRQRIEPVPVVRTFQLTAADGSTRHLGLLGANETAIACSGEAALALRLTVPGLSRTGQARVTITDEAKHSWNVVLSPIDLKSVVRATVARGTYALAVESPHYRTFRKSVRAGAKPETVVAVLEALPILSGRVFARDSADGLPGAVIATNVETSAITDGTGSWSLESDPEKWPATFTVSAAGYAETKLPVPKARTSARLEDVYLNRGGSISVEVAGVEDAGVREIALQTLRSGEKIGRPFKSIPIDDEARPVRVRFDHIDPGRYVVLAKGSGPLEQRGEAVELREGETKEVVLRISTIRLRLRTTMSGQPLPAARIVLDLNDGHWNGRLESDAKGEVTVPLWQGGAVLAAVRAESLMTIPHFETHTIAEDEEVAWTIDVPGRSIRGKVIDSKTGEPISDAVISLNASGTANGVGFGVRTRSDSEGRFRFVPVPYGKHTLRAASATHLETFMSYTFSPPDESRDVTIKLDGGAIVRLRVLDAAGTPVAGALALQYDGFRQTRISTTDASGIAELIIPDGETRDVYVIPRDGSFGITRVSSKSQETTTRLPVGASRIEVRAESDAHEPIPNVSVVMRYNRQLLPVDVVSHFGRVQGAWTRSHADGRLLFDHMPAGLYELWPAGSPAELELVTAGAGAQAPVSMTVVPGENVAVLTFAPGSR